MRSLRRTAAALLAAALLTACAATPQGDGGAAAPVATMGTNPVDPWEAFNRKMFAFNEALDEAVLKPVATAYRDHVPELVRRGVDNVLQNVGDVWSAANHLLQCKVEIGLNMGMRVLTNTLFGLGGLLDPATEFGLLRRSEDFGQTLGRWGIGPGPYVVWPLFGPRTVRDSFGLVADWQFEPNRLVSDDAGRYAASALSVVNTRANLLAASSLLTQVALDKYSFLRDAYLARRLDAIYDGAPPLDTFDDDPGASPPRKEE